jgi:hypothetical protein
LDLVFGTLAMGSTIVNLRFPIGQFGGGMEITG